MDYVPPPTLLLLRDTRYDGAALLVVPGLQPADELCLPCRGKPR